MNYMFGALRLAGLGGEAAGLYGWGRGETVGFMGREAPS